MNAADSSQSEYLPPANLDAEQSLIGAVMVNNDAYELTKFIVRPEDFHEPLHGRIWDAIGRITDKGVVASPITLKTEFQNDTPIGDLPIPLYLANLATGATTVANAPGYAELVKEMAVRRQIMVVGYELVERAQRAPIDDAPDAMATDAIHYLDEVIAAQQRNRASLSFAKEATGHVLELAERREVQRRLVPTGWVDLDKATGGLPIGAVTVIAGRPGMGKSTIGTGIARNVAKTGTGVLILSLEMPADDITARILSDECFTTSATTCPYRNILEGDLDALQLDRLKERAPTVEALPLAIEQKGALTLEEVSSRIRQVRAVMDRKGIRLEVVIVDHMGLMGASRARKSVYEEVTEISHGLLRIARDAQVAMVALAQLSREVEKEHSIARKRPKLSDIRESGHIEQDAQVVLFAFRRAYYLQRAKEDAVSSGDAEKIIELEDQLNACRNDLEIIIAKQRNGATGTIKLRCDMPNAAIRLAAGGR
jgi:replicative DNA helicase